MMHSFLFSMMTGRARAFSVFRIIPPLLLCFFIFAATMFMGVAAWKDSAIIDEIPHIAAGYGYVRHLDARLNPEHPPLVKMLAATPLLFAQPVFPLNAQSWTSDVNGQWDMGVKFLYQSGNNADLLIFLSRIAPILLTLLLIIVTYWWAQELIGRWWALLPAFLLSFSPTILAHGHYVTTDIGAALGVLVSLYAFVSYLTSPTRKRLIWAGVALGVALLLKFSTVLLVPFLIFLAIVYSLIGNKKIRTFWRLVGALILMGIIASVLIYIVYAIITINYPLERQVADTESILQSFQIKPLADLTIWMAHSPVFRPFAQYLLGVLMVLQRSAGGNTVYFLGEVTNMGWWYYFPVVFFVKETIPSLALLGIAGMIWARFTYLSIAQRIGRKLHVLWRIFSDYLQTHFAEFTLFSFVVFYWVYSMSSPLNIGVRHIFPTVPLLYILVAAGVKKWTLAPLSSLRVHAGIFGMFWRVVRALGRGGIVLLLLVWMSIETAIAFPQFLPYMNQFVGGTDKGYTIAVDSNYDWGQDVKRFGVFAKETIPKDERIAVDFFGWEPSYYVGDRAVVWHSSSGDPREEGISWLAVSVGFIQNSIGEPVRDFVRNPEDEYRWLREIRDPYAPDYRIGESIFVYKLE